MAFDAEKQPAGLLPDLLPEEVHPSLTDLKLDRINILRRALWDAPDHKFDMAYWLLPEDGVIDDRDARNFTQDHTAPSCGSVMCIGGWTQALFGKEVTSLTLTTSKLAGALLGVDTDDAWELFYPGERGHYSCPDSNDLWDDIDKYGAVRVITHYVRTGEVDWRVRA